MTDSGDLSVTTAAALVGTYGLQAVIDDTTPIYVEDDTPTAEARYRARFSFDPNAVTLPAGEDHDILDGRTSSATVFRVQLLFVNGAYHVRAKVRNDAGVDINTTSFPITDAPHLIEAHWQAASAPGANDGALSLWLDGALRQTVTGLDNDTLRIDEARLGPSGSLNAGTSGTEYFDAFEWGRQIAIGDVLFADGFESGNSLAWSAAVTDSGDLSVTTGAALVGTYGLQAVIDDTTPIYVEDDTPTAEARYRARFYFDPNAVTLPSGEDHDILAGRTSTSAAFRVQVAFVSGAYQVRAKIRDDAGADASSADYTLSDAAHFVEVDWAAASAPGANNGYLSLWLDGVLKETKSGIDNDTLRIEKARLGPSGSLSAGITGTEYFDAFESREQTYIGPVGGSSGESSLVTATITYTYDPLYRLTGANYSGGYTYTFAYRYDAVGNRTVQTRTITSTLATTYTYDAANRLTNAGGVAYTWNANGNLLNDGNATYAYDFENRLVSTTLSGVNTQFGYNGDGIRLRLIEAGALTTYTQDYAAPLPVVVQAKTGSASTQYVYSMDTGPVAEYEAAAWEYLLADPLGSVRQLVNSSGNVTLLKSYEPYGSVLNSQGSATSIFGYAGEQTDTTGLVYLRARYMQPRLGLFLSRDAWEGDVLRPGSMNGWNYVEGSPINATDPSGKITAKAALSILGLQNPLPGTTQFDIILETIPLEILEQLDRWFCKVPSDSLPQPEPVGEWGIVYAEGAAGVIVANFGNQGIWIGREVVYNIYTKLTITMSSPFRKSA